MSYADRRAPSESGRGRRGALGRSDDSLWPAFGCRGVADPRRPAQLPPGAGLVDGTARSGDDRVGHPDAAASAAGVDGTRRGGGKGLAGGPARSEEHTSELQSLMRISYAVFCLKKKNIVLRKF